MTELYLVRHPETPHNADRSIVSGRSNAIPVTPKGLEQARRFAQAYQASYPAPDLLVSSPAVRATTLMDIYLEETGQKRGYFIESAIQEMSQGVADGRPRADVYTNEVIARINEELFDFALPEGESLNQVADRMLAWAWSIHRLQPNGVVLAVSHGQAIRAAAGRLLGWTHVQTTRDPLLQTPNVSLTHFSIDNTKITVQYVGKEIITPIE